MSSFTDTKEREKVVDFVTYFQAGEGFYVKAGSRRSSTGSTSLCGATVAVETGTTEQTDAQSQAQEVQGQRSLSFADQNEANLAVSSGRADVGFADSQVAGYIVKQSNGQFQATGTAFARRAVRHRAAEGQRHGPGRADRGQGAASPTARTPSCSPSGACRPVRSRRR